MSFTPFEMSIKDIFLGDRRYKIPNFQREFSWENENFDDFYEDLFKSSGLTISNTIAVPENKYFFGMILLLGDKSSPNEELPYEVIDGQQRLTTMILFFAAIQDIIKGKSKDYETEFEERLFCKRTKQGKTHEVQRLVNESLDPVLPVSILNLNNFKKNKAVVKPNSNEQTWLLNSYDYIKKLLDKDNLADSLNVKIDELDDSLYLNILDGLGNHLSNSTLICIFHDNKEEANNLFRNLNFRGKPLTQSDLLKNELFSILEDSGKFASETWKIIEDNVYKSEETLQKYIYHYMYGRYSQVTNNNMFERFNDNVENNKAAYIKFLNSLCNASSYYKIILKPQDNEKIFEIDNYFKTNNNASIKRNLEFFKSIDISQCRILLITLFECREKNIIKNKLFRKFIDLIARHQSLHVLAKSSPNKLTSIYAKASRAFVTLIKKIDEIKDSDEIKKIENFCIQESEKIYNVLKQDFLDRIPDSGIIKEKKLIYSGKKISDMKPKERKEHALIRFILQKLSEEAQDKSINKANDALEFIYNSTLEHIINKSENVENVLSLGNIILLEKDEHKDCETLALKEEMYDKSKITKTKQFFKDYPRFGEDQILKRQQELLETYFNLVKNTI